jgi:uncharacterized protein YndB with AHSA1/START domain
MEPLTITRTIEIAAPRQRVWDALTTPELLSQWLGQEAVFEPKVGAKGSYSWSDWGRFPLIVEQVEEPSRLAVRWARSPDGELTESTSTVAHYQLDEIDGGTLLTVVETGFELLDGNQQTSFEDNTKGWAEELGELKVFLESVSA